MFFQEFDGHFSFNVLVCVILIKWSTCLVRSNALSVKITGPKTFSKKLWGKYTSSGPFSLYLPENWFSLIFKPVTFFHFYCQKLNHSIKTMKIWFYDDAIKKATGVPLNSTSQPAFTCSKLTIETLEHHWCRSGIFIINFEHISHLVLVFVLLTLNM